jgi:fusaric acid resistance family protein
LRGTPALAMLLRGSTTREKPLLSRVHSVGRDDDLLGGMWAVLATIFVLRDSFGKSMADAVSRMAATFVSFVLCLVDLAFLPFHAWALAVLVAVSPHHAWQQPILRLVDTVVGVAVGALAAWASTRIRHFMSRSLAPAPAQHP